VHATKATVRPAVTAGTAGTGNWFVSLLEDLVALLLSVLSLLVPLVVGLLLIFLFAYIIAWAIRRRRRRSVSHRSSLRRKSL
jgi:predicted PurR-regulated permease PerM